MGLRFTLLTIFFLFAGAQNLFADSNFGKGNRVKVSADEVFNTYYQSCDAAGKAPYQIFEQGEMRGYSLQKHPDPDFTGKVPRLDDVRLAQDSQYYLSCGSHKKVQAGCRDLCATPPTYIWGGKGIYSKNGPSFNVDPFSNHVDIENIAHHPGIDCSGYVNLIFANAGLRVQPGKPFDYVATNTGARFFMTASECFKSVVANPENTNSIDFLQPGDVVAWAGHVLMVDNLGRDPFGLKDIESVKDCNNQNLKPSSFTLVMSNAVGSIIDAPKDNLNGVDITKLSGVGIGVSKWPLNQYIFRRPVEVMELAKIACYAKFGQVLPFKSTNILRHIRANELSTAADDVCVARKEEQIHLEGKECLASCK